MNAPTKGEPDWAAVFIGMVVCMMFLTIGLGVIMQNTWEQLLGWTMLGIGLGLFLGWVLYLCLTREDRRY